MSGYNGSFNPYATISRGEVATILWRLAGSPSADSEDFIDVNYSLYYGTAIRWARSSGVISGYGSTNTFGPNDPVTRQQLCLMLANYYKVVYGGSYSGMAKESMERIYDSSSVADWAADAVCWCNMNDIMTGTLIKEPIKTADGNYIQQSIMNPEGSAQRCQAAKMIAVFARIFEQN